MTYPTEGGTVALFWVFSALILLSHVFNLFHEWLAPGKRRPFYTVRGFGVIFVANFLLGMAVYAFAFPSNPCEHPVGYCATISCVSGNAVFQGYVFMFVVLTLNAYIGLRDLDPKNAGAHADGGGEGGGGGGDDANGGHDAGAHGDAGGEGGGGGEGGDLIEKHGDMRSDQPRANIQGCIRSMHKKICDLRETWMRLGLLLTTVTGIFPMLQYDNAGDDLWFPQWMNFLHSFGIAVGVFLLVVGISIKEMPLAKFRGVFRGGQRRSVADSNLDKFLDLYDDTAPFLFVVTCFVTVVLFFYASWQKSQTEQISWFCTLYEDENECSGGGRDLERLGLLPWPCEWNRDTQVACTNPNCNEGKEADWNANSIVTEFLVLSVSIAYFAHHRCKK